jgi:hypothetical protein
MEWLEKHAVSLWKDTYLQVLLANSKASSTGVDTVGCQIRQRALTRPGAGTFAPLPNAATAVDNFFDGPLSILGGRDRDRPNALSGR